MNLLRIFGAACVDPTFRENLFQDPDGTVLNYGFALTAEQLANLEMIIRGHNPSLKQDFTAVGKVICPKRPCLYAQDPLLPVYGAAAVDSNFRTNLFRDPVTTPVAYGFALTFFERSLITDLINNYGQTLKAAFETLGAKIGAICPLTFIMGKATPSAGEAAA